MIVEDFEKNIKVIVVGNGTVGKSSLLLRFCNGDFTLGYKKTIGVDFLEKAAIISMGDGSKEKLNFLLWDTAGQEEFDSMTRSYYRGADAALLVFSVTDRASFEAIPTWHAKVADECGDLLTVVVQNKVDLMEQATVTPADVDKLREQLGIRVFRTSVKENFNVNEVFEYIATNYLRICEGNSDVEATSPGNESVGLPVVDGDHTQSISHAVGITVNP